MTTTDTLLLQVDTTRERLASLRTAAMGNVQEEVLCAMIDVIQLQLEQLQRLVENGPNGNPAAFSSHARKHAGLGPNVPVQT
jgi:hypothetical protein